MRAAEVTVGRTIVVALAHGEDFFAGLEQACDRFGIRQGYIPAFIAGFSEADVVGTCERLEDPAAPVWSSVHLRNVEAMGCGTLATTTEDELSLHLHVSLGLKEHSATAHTSHLLRATVQFLTELILVEIASPAIARTPEATLYDVPLLRFGHDNAPGPDGTG